MSHDKIKAATRKRKAQTGERHAAARREVIRDHQAAQGGGAASRHVVWSLSAAHDEMVHAVTVGPVGNLDVVVSGSADKTVRIWDAATGAPVGAPLLGHRDAVRAVALGRAKDQDVIVSGSADKTVRIWDAATGAPVGAPLLGHRDAVYVVAVGRAGGRDLIVSGDDDETVQVWDAATGALLRTLRTAFKLDPGGIRAVAFSRARDRDVIIAGSVDGTVWIWDVVTGDPVGTMWFGHDLNGGPRYTMAYRWPEDQELIVWGSEDETPRTWDDETLRTWDARTADPAWALWVGQDRPGGTDDVVQAIGRAGKRDVIITGSLDGTVWVWNAAIGAPAGTLRLGRAGRIPNSDDVYGIAVGRAGKRDVIITGSLDGTVRVWNAATGYQVGAPLAGHHGTALAVAVGRAGDRDVIISGDTYGTVMVQEPH